MEILGLFEVPLWLLMIPCVFVSLYFYATAPFGHWKRLGQNGPPATPFFGHMGQIFGDGFTVSVNRMQKQYGRMLCLYFFRKPLLIVSDISALKQLMVKDFHSYADRSMAGGDYLMQSVVSRGLFFSRGSQWHRIRRIMTPLFSSGKLKVFVSHMNRTAKQLADVFEENAEKGGHPPAKQVYGAFALDIIAGTAFGLELNSQKNPDSEFFTNVTDLITFGLMHQMIIMSAEALPFLGPIYKFFDVGFLKSGPLNYFKNHMYSYLDDRKLHPENYKKGDFMQLLLDAESDASEEIVGAKKMTADEIVSQAIIFIIAGYDTSSTSLQFISYELARNPDIQQKVMEEINSVVGPDDDPTYETCQNLKYTEAVINESLRMYPPVPFITRECVKATTLNDIPMDVGNSIFIPIMSIGRDPEYFDDPDTFTPDRFLGDNKRSMESISFLTFGFGPRQCVGLRVAMMQMKIALVHILRKVSIVGATPEHLDLQDAAGLLVPKEKIHLILEKRV